MSTVLAFDTSGPACTVALFQDTEVIAEARAEMARGQAEALMPMIADLMAEAGIGRRHLSAIGVGTGPGNFTGLRIAVAAARGMALGLGIPAIGVDAFRALYGGHEGPALVVLPAPRDSFYVQRLGPDGPETPATPVLIGPKDPLPDLPGDANPVVIAPAGAELSARDWQPYGEIKEGAPLAPSIATIAAQRLRSGAPLDRPTPLYIRPADAAPARHAPPVHLPEQPPL